MKDLPPKPDLMDKVWSMIRMAWHYEGKLYEPDIEKWLNNFTGHALSVDGDDGEAIKSAKEKEQQIALFLLCNFVFYNENEVKHLTRLMFEKYIHLYFATRSIKNVDNNSINKLLGETQFTPLGQVSESSSYLLYHFRQENDLSKNNFKRRNGIKNIVFVDDFSITGSQAKNYIEAFMKDNTDYIAGKRIFVLLMVTTDVALNELYKIVDLTVLPCITMDDKSKAFSESSIIFDGYNDEVKQCAKKICEYYGAILYSNTEPLGYGGGGYMFGSYYNIPDNTLPIFWSDHNDWNYLFKRYNKIYGDTSVAFGGRYV